MNVFNRKEIFDKLSNNRHIPLQDSAITVLDIETLGTDTVNGSPILTISLLSFSPVNKSIVNTRKIINSTDIRVELADQILNYGLKINYDTLNWHKSLPKDVSDNNLSGFGLTVTESCDIVYNYIMKINDEYDSHYIFGNSPEFDQGMINKLYSLSNKEAPWLYFQNLDYRTVRMISNMTKQKRKEIIDNMYESNADSLIPLIGEHTSYTDVFIEGYLLVNMLGSEVLEK